MQTDRHFASGGVLPVAFRFKRFSYIDGQDRQDIFYWGFLDSRFRGNDGS